MNIVVKILVILKVIFIFVEFQMIDFDEEKDFVRDIFINKVGSFMFFYVFQQMGRNRQQNGEVFVVFRQRFVISLGNFYLVQLDIVVNFRVSQSDGFQVIKEEVFRGEFIVLVVFQDISIYIEGGMDGFYLECVFRKIVQKYFIDRSVIDKGDKRFREI